MHRKFFRPDARMRKAMGHDVAGVEHLDLCVVRGRDMTFGGGGMFTASNSLNLGHNSGITITPHHPAAAAAS
jgi:hypothetical protein